VLKSGNGEGKLTAWLFNHVDVIPTPGAIISTAVPKFEKLAKLSLLSVAPTAYAVTSDEGEVSPASWASFPAATVTKTPLATTLATAALTLVDLGPPRDMVAMEPALQPVRVFESVPTKLIPARTPELVPCGVCVSTTEAKFEGVV
jgi:hypothetical protein